MSSTSPTHIAALEAEIDALRVREAHLEVELQTRRRFLNEIGQAAGVGAWELDTSTRRMRWSDMVFRIFDLPVGAEPTPGEVLAHLPYEARYDLGRAVLRLQRRGTPFDLELALRTDTGHTRWVRCLGRTDGDANPSNLVFGTLQDLTAQRQAQDELRVSQKLLSHAASMAGIGAWSIELATNTVTWSDEVFRIHDMEPGPMPTLEQAVDFYTPEASKTIEAGLAGLLEAGHLLDVELPLITAKQRPIWVRSMGDVERDPAGQPVRLFGMFQDVTEQRRAKDLLKESEERLLLAIDGARDGVWDWYPGNDSIHFSPGWKALIGYDEDELANDPVEWTGRIHPDDLEQTLEHVRLCLSERESAYRAEFRMRHKDHSWRWILARGKVVSRDINGLATRMVGTHTDITEQVLLRDELLRAKEGAEAAARAKSDFLATMSHEIRTPMNGILGMTQVLLSGSLDPEQQDHAQTIFDSGSALLGILNDILDLSKFEAGKILLETAPFTPSKCIEEVVELLRVQAEDKDIDLLLELEEDLPQRILGDEGRLRQIVLNLTGNAIKFTTEGEVRVRVGVRGDARPRLRVEVHDTGIGISSEQSEALFEAFTQADASTTRQFGGTGLGLTICRNFIRLMEGEIGCHGEPGSGTTFWIEIPLVLDVRTDAELLESQPSLLPSETVERTVLVVEDNPVNRVVASKLLESMGCRVTLVTNGREALDAVRDERFDVVFMDCQMPIMDGYEATGILRQDEAASGTPRLRIVAMTANALQGDRERCLEAGMDDYVAKPIVRRELEEALMRSPGSSTPTTSTT